MKNSILLFIGLILTVIGVFLASYKYFESKKNKAFSDMNILLYENEIPKEVKEEEKINPTDLPEVVEPENPQTENNSTFVNYNFIGILEIPKIGIKNGFLSLDSKYNDVNYNITVIKGSTFPDVENGNLILAAHSGNCSICYFNSLYKLDVEDIAYVYYKNYKYEYKIVNIYEVEKTGLVSISRKMDVNSLTLITCTRNSDTKQTVYILELTKKSKY